MKRIRGMVIGEVQGVGFRAFTRRQAVLFGLSGWVKNKADGNVEFEIEGREDCVTEFLAALRRGPSMAIVSELSISKEEEIREPQYQGFEIRF